MFDSDLDRSERNKFGKEQPPANLQRRAFLATSAATLAGLAFWHWRRSPVLEVAAAPPDKPRTVTLVRFDDTGKKLEKVHVPMVVKTLDEWRKQLSPNVFDITRKADTEIAYTGKYWNVHEKGLYRCICCDNALFDSSTKFDSGTGWPSFWAPIASENVRESSDKSLGMERTAVSCTECDAHLGHVFDDGPPPTHLRFCMNSASLRFVPRG